MTHEFLLDLHRRSGLVQPRPVRVEDVCHPPTKPVVLERCSMLTEEQLAALLDAVKGVE
jgi:hypothetical protein